MKPWNTERPRIGHREGDRLKAEVKQLREENARLSTQPVMLSGAALALVIDAALRVERQRIVDAVQGEMASTPDWTSHGKAKLRAMRRCLDLIGDGPDESEWLERTAAVAGSRPGAQD